MPTEGLLAWRIAVVWRRGVAAFLIGYWILHQLVEIQWISFRTHHTDDTQFGLVLLSLMFAFSSTPWAIPRPVPSSFSRRIASTLSLVASLAVLCWMVLCVSRRPAYNHWVRDLFVFIAFAAASLSASLLGIWLVAVLESWWKKTVSRCLRWTLIGMCLFITAAYVIWLNAWGLHSVHRSILGELHRPWHSWLGAGLLVCSVAAALAYRAYLTRQGCHDHPRLIWRGDRDNYWNEHPLVLTLLCVTGVVWFVRALVQDWVGNSLFAYGSTVPQTVGVVGLTCLSAQGLLHCGDSTGENALHGGLRVRSVDLVYKWLLLVVFVIGAR
jgi:hypothetical protein